MKHLLLYIGAIIYAAGCQPVQDAPNTISIRILDQTNQPTAARVRFTDLDGIYYAPEGHRADFEVTSANVPESIEKDVMMDLDRRFAYVEGEFNINLPRSTIKVEVVKGFHYKMVDDTVDLTDHGTTLEIVLEKWFDPPEGNWYSGDVHVHFINPESAMLEMQAEDLNVCNVLVSDFTTDHDLFRGEPEPISEATNILYYGQEFREDRLGHVNILNLKDRLIEPSKEPRGYQYPLNLSASEEVHRQGGHISWAHFAAWPGLEGPLALALKKVDAVELLCTIDPFHEPIFVSDVVPEVQLNSGLRLWYRLLNCGFHIPATAGTDKMNNQVTVGANRVYAQVQGEFNYDNWTNALNQGRTFISNSPFLHFEVEGQGPGSMIQADGKTEFLLTAEVWSQLPIDRLEIVANGELVAEQAISRGENHSKVQIRYRADQSVWLAARAYQFSREAGRKGVSFSQRRDAEGGPTQLNQYFGTLRPETVFSHTSPVYLVIDEKPMRSEPDAAYFVRYLENSINWLEKSGKFPSEEAKKEVLEAFKKGKGVFETLGIAEGRKDILTQ